MTARSKAVPLYELLTYGRMDKSGDFCKGAHLTRTQALNIILFTLSDNITEDDVEVMKWISDNMPEDGSRHG